MTNGRDLDAPSPAPRDDRAAGSPGSASQGRNAYAELLRGTRGLRREQQQARDAAEKLGGRWN